MDNLTYFPFPHLYQAYRITIYDIIGIVKRSILYFIFLTLLNVSQSMAENTNFKPIESAEIKTFYSSSPSFIKLAEGTALQKGVNLYFYENGYYKPKDNFSINYTMRQYANADFYKAEIHKAYLNYRPGIFSLTFGKTSKTIGISDNSLILSQNAPPFPMLDMENEKPLKLLGEWKFEILNGWLDEKREDLSNTRIIILRSDYMPTPVLNFGITRFEQYGGSGRPDYKIWEFPKLLLGSQDNKSYSKYDADGYLGWDIKLNMEKYFHSYKKFQIYYQEIGTDIRAPWQKEDKGKYSLPLIVRLQALSHQAGIKIETEKDIFNLEYTSVNSLFYTHHFYNIEGYSYDGFSLGHPYGNNLWEIYFAQKHFLKENDYFKYKIGFLKQPAFSFFSTIYAQKSKNYYLETEYHTKIGDINFAPYIRLEYSDNYDADRRPMQYDIKTANKLYIITGLSTKIHF